MLAIKNETCKVQLPSNPTNFRINTVKSYLQKHPNTKTPVLHDWDDSKSDLDQSAKENTINNKGDKIDASELPCFKTWLIYLYF